MKIAPLSKGFMILAIFGFLAVVIYWESLGLTWGFTLGILFFAMFIASMISMTYGPSEAELSLDKLKFMSFKKKSKKAKARKRRK